MILVISPKNIYAAKRLVEEGRRRKAEVGIQSVEELAEAGFKISISEFDVFYVRNPYVKGSPKYIPDIIKLAKKFKRAGKKVVDDVISDGHLGEGKMVDYNHLLKAKIPIPKEILFHGREKVFPFIVKWIYGMKAKGTFLIRSEKDFKKIPASIPKSQLMVQEFIPAEYEYKVITVGYKSLPVVLRFKTAASGFRVDFENHQVLKKKDAMHPVKLAEKASKVLGRELSKVDILEAKGKFYVLEVNRFPGLKSFEDLTKYNVAGVFVEYLRK